MSSLIEKILSSNKWFDIKRYEKTRKVSTGQ